MAATASAPAASSAADWLAPAWAALRPPPRMSLSQWADAHFALSAESAAAPGRWKSLAYQRGILDAITDPDVERVTVEKSARVGYTKMINAAVAYHMDTDPATILVVQPTVEDAEGYSKEEIAPMLRDVPRLDGLVRESTKSSSSTILHKTFPGGVISMVGANSGRGLRRISRRIVIFDEVDAYPPSAGNEGDPIKLGERRSSEYWNRKIISGSTPLVAGSSRIAELFEAGDQRRFYVPCPHCTHMDFLTFDKNADRGHRMRWFDDNPETACFECSACKCFIQERDRRDMIERGEWRAEREFRGHASFHIWAAYGLGPNSAWSEIVAEFLGCNGDSEKLRTFVNTVLGETWIEKGEAPEWKVLQTRSKIHPYERGTVPSEAVVVVTAGVDVQQDRFVWEAVAWSARRVSWSVDKGEIHGDTADDATWERLDSELLARTFPGAGGAQWSISSTAVDSGFRAQQAYWWGRRHATPYVLVTKGQHGLRPLIGTASPVEVSHRGKRIQRGYRVWPIGVDVAKGELYGWLKLELGADGPPVGYCYFPDGYDDEFYRQLTAEHLVKTVHPKTRRATYEWRELPNRENHHLDVRILARVAAAVLGIDRMAPRAPAAGGAPQPARHEVRERAAAAPPARARGGWLGGGRRGGGWLR